MGNILPPDLENPQRGEALRGFDSYLEAYAPEDLLWIWPHRTELGWIGMAELDYIENCHSFLLPAYQWAALETAVIISADYILRDFEKNPPDQWRRRSSTEQLCKQLSERRYTLEVLAKRGRGDDGIEALPLGRHYHFDRFHKELSKCAYHLRSHHHRTLIELVLGVLSLQADPKCRSFHLPSQVADAQELHFKKLEQRREELMEAKAAALNARLRQGRT